MSIKNLEKIIDDTNEVPPFCVKDMKDGERIEISTKNSVYILEKRNNGFYISCNREDSQYLKEPQKITNIGSTWGGSAIRYDYIELSAEDADRYLEFTIEGKRGVIRTSPIKSIDFPEK